MSADRISPNGSLPKDPNSRLIEARARIREEALKRKAEARNQQVEQALATRYDALNQGYIEAEQHMKSLKPLHAVWVDYGHDPDENNWELVGIAQYQGKWRLCHASDNQMNDYGPFDIMPIVECRRDIRVRAARQVRRLPDLIVKSKEEHIPEVDEAINELTQLCNEI